MLNRICVYSTMTVFNSRKTISGTCIPQKKTVIDIAGVVIPQSTVNIFDGNLINISCSKMLYAKNRIKHILWLTQNSASYAYD